MDVDGILDSLDATIRRYRVARRQLRVILLDVQNLERGVNVSKTLSTTANTVGQALLLTPEFPLGLALLVFGGVLSLGTWVTEKSITKVKVDELVRSLRSADQAMVNLQPGLVYLHALFGNGLGVPISQRTADTIYSLLDKSLLSAISGKIGSQVPQILSNIGQKAAQAARAARHAQALRYLDALSAVDAAFPVMVDGVRIVETPAVRTARFQQYTAAMKEAGKTITKTAAEVPTGALATAGSMLTVAGVAVDIGSTVYGWATTHPSVTRVEDEISKVDTLLTHLDNLRNDLVLAIAT